MTGPSYPADFPSFTLDDRGHVAYCPTCDWKSDSLPFKGSARLNYHRHLENSTACAEAFEAGFKEVQS